MTAFAGSRKAVVEDPRWADVFDGLDITDSPGLRPGGVPPNE
ncbi:hypothetical protein WBG99_10265 [Streptomyces sp. TG1A-60]